MEISATFRSLAAPCQMLDIEFNICAWMNERWAGGCFNGKTCVWGATLRRHQGVELHHTRVSPVNPDKGRITQTGIATESCENFFLP